MYPVQRSREIERVAGLPRRRWTPEQIETLTARLTEALRSPQGTQTLRPLQALALAEIAQWGGAFVPIPVGGGKTLTLLLAARMLPHVVSPLFLMPASLIAKTEEEAREYRKHWNLPTFWRCESYETLARVGAADMLDRLRPDLIVCDEAQALKNPKASATRRIHRYLDEHRSSGRRIHFVPMTGTPGRSIRDFAHLTAWSLKHNPCPESWPVMDEWCRAMDADVIPVRRLAPGPLLTIATEPVDPWEDPGTQARRAFRGRLRDTPGVIISQEEPLPIPLEIRTVVTPIDQAQERAFDDLRRDWVTPDGITCSDGPSVWRHARELSTGFYSVWDPRPPAEWADPRRDWNAACREILASNRRNIDTEDQLARALEAHPTWYPEAADLRAAWLAVKDTFVPNPVPYWISSTLLDWIVRWAAESPGLIWTDRPAVGAALAARGIPYYGQEGIDLATGRYARNHNPIEGSICLARGANSTGQNLQAWSRNLLIDVPANEGRWEQMLGRTHRPGQQAPRVTFDVLIGSIEDVSALWKAHRRAASAQDLCGNPQKLCHVDLSGCLTEEAAALLPGARWRKTK